MNGDASPMWTLHLDLAVTRRKVYHVITDQIGTVLFRSRFASECMAFLAEQDQQVYVLAPSPVRNLGRTIPATIARSA